MPDPTFSSDPTKMKYEGNSKLKAEVCYNFILTFPDKFWERENSVGNNYKTFRSDPDPLNTKSLNFRVFINGSGSFKKAGFVSYKFDHKM